MGRPKGSKNKPKNAANTAHNGTSLVMTPEAINARTIAILRALSPFASKDATRINLTAINVRSVVDDAAPSRACTILEATDGHALAQVLVTYDATAPSPIGLSSGMYDPKVVAKYLAIGQAAPRVVDAGRFPEVDQVIPARRETNDAAVAAFNGQLFARVTEGVDALVAAFGRGHGVPLRVQMATDNLSPALVLCDFYVLLDGHGSAHIEARGVLMPMRD